MARKLRTSWCADNLNGLHFAGVETSFTWIPKKSQTVRIEWTALHGAQTALHGLESEYVFNYPVENIHASWSWAIGTRHCADECGAACSAVSTDGVPSVECDIDARRLESAAVFAAHECEQHRLPGDHGREYAAADDHGRGCGAAGAITAAKMEFSCPRQASFCSIDGVPRQPAKESQTAGSTCFLQLLRERGWRRSKRFSSSMRVFGCCTGWLFREEKATWLLRLRVRATGGPLLEHTGKVCLRFTPAVPSLDSTDPNAEEMSYEPSRESPQNQLH